MGVPLDLPKPNISKYAALIQRPCVIGESAMHLGMLLKAIPVILSMPKFCWLNLVTTGPCYILV